MTKGKPKQTSKKRAKVVMSDARELRVGLSQKRSTKERIAAFLRAPLAVCDDDKNLQSLLKVLRNREEPLDVRLAALQALQAASFSVTTFESCRTDYISVLRDLTSDPDFEMRQRVFGFLAREKDGYAQKKLIEGLKNPSKALLPAEKALQLLGYDPHSDAYAIAREIVNKPPNPLARREALRLLAADGTAVPLFERVLRDKKEVGEIRQIAASALQALRPDKLQTHAREMVLDAKEHDDIKATSLTALENFGDDAAVSKDTALLKAVDRLTDKGSAKVKLVARKLLRKYGQ